VTGGNGTNVRASMLDDSGTELVGQTFAMPHRLSARVSGSAFPNFVGQPAGLPPVDVAVDYAKLTTGLTGEVAQAFRRWRGNADGRAALSRIEPGPGARFSASKGWINPANVTNSPNVPDVRAGDRHGAQAASRGLTPVLTSPRARNCSLRHRPGLVWHLMGAGPREAPGMAQTFNRAPSMATRSS